MSDQFRHNGPSIVISSERDLVEFRPSPLGNEIPRVAVPRVKDVDLLSWIESASEVVNQALRRHGAILFRGFPALDDTALGQLLGATGTAPMTYVDQHTPRQGIGENLYTSTEYPAEQKIELHSEMSYSAIFPKRICFCCRTPATVGGSTPIADNQEVYSRIDPRVRQRFMDRGIRYVRNFGSGVGISWQHAFNTEDSEAVDDFCRRNGMCAEWLSGGRLRTFFVSTATLVHPESGASLWFNQAHAFHYSSLPTQVRASLAACLSEDEYPSNAFFGNGSAIPEEDLAAIRNAYDEASVRFPWESGDILILDNLRISHGRDPFRGARKILVSLGGMIQRAVP